MKRIRLYIKLGLAWIYYFKLQQERHISSNKFKFLKCKGRRGEIKGRRGEMLKRIFMDTLQIFNGWPGFNLLKKRTLKIFDLNLKNILHSNCCEWWRNFEMKSNCCCQQLTCRYYEAYCKQLLFDSTSTDIDRRLLWSWLKNFCS